VRPLRSSFDFVFRSASTFFPAEGCLESGIGITFFPLVRCNNPFASEMEKSLRRSIFPLMMADKTVGFFFSGVRAFPSPRGCRSAGFLPDLREHDEDLLTEGRRMFLLVPRSLAGPFSLSAPRTFSPFFPETKSCLEKIAVAGSDSFFFYRTANSLSFN